MTASLHDVLANLIAMVGVGVAVVAVLMLLLAGLLLWSKSCSSRRQFEMGTNAAMRRLLREQDAAGIPSARRGRR